MIEGGILVRSTPAELVYPICTKCKHCFKGSDPNSDHAASSEYFSCLHPKAAITNVLDGSSYQDTCGAMRTRNSMCGLEGKWFEAYDGYPPNK